MRIKYQDKTFLIFRKKIELITVRQYYYIKKWVPHKVGIPRMINNN